MPPPVKIRLPLPVYIPLSVTVVPVGIVIVTFPVKVKPVEWSDELKDSVWPSAKVTVHGELPEPNVSELVPFGFRVSLKPLLVSPLFTDKPFSFSPGVPVHVPAELIAVTSEEGVAEPVEVMLKVLLAMLVLSGNRIAATAGVAVVTSTAAE